MRFQISLPIEIRPLRSDEAARGAAGGRRSVSAGRNEACFEAAAGHPLLALTLAVDMLDEALEGRELEGGRTSLGVRVAVDRAKAGPIKCRRVRIATAD